MHHLNCGTMCPWAVGELVCHCLLAEIPTKVILDKFGKLDPGDMVLGNDGHIVRSGHLPDWTFPAVERMYSTPFTLDVMPPRKGA